MKGISIFFFFIEKQDTLRTRGGREKNKVRRGLRGECKGWWTIDRSGSNLHAKTTSPLDAYDAEYDSHNAVVGFSPFRRRTQPSIVCKG